MARIRNLRPYARMDTRLKTWDTICNQLHEMGSRVTKSPDGKRQNRRRSNRAMCARCVPTLSGTPREAPPAQEFLELRVADSARMRNHVADVAHAGQVHHEALEAQTEAGVVARAVAAQVAVVLILLGIHA